MQKIYIISTGPGCGEYLTEQAKDRINQVDLVIGPSRFESIVKDKFFYVYKNVIEDTIDFIVKNRDRNIGLLVSGDAGFFSLSKHIIKYFGKDYVEVLPGVSIVQTVFAKLKEPWESTKFYSFHGKKCIDLKIDSLLNNSTLILCDSKYVVAEFIEENIKIINLMSVWVMQNVTLEDELVLKIDCLDDLLNLKENKLTVLVILPG